ncbi:sensor histidine kinase [Paenibacillus bouchesdurhonensis]|uniref:sensor histidine kinase n=1 Tax=Paenibacillus bouchesdurhonensis TaxID=1870990 RepID=UPI000DA5F9BD|nr:histidine kinase [Paenibacillus bouchesdurhonensis]
MLRKKLNQISLYQRIQLSFIIFILLPFVVITYNSYTSIRDNVARNVKEASINTVDVTADHLNKTVESILFASLYFSELKDTEMLESLRILSEATRFSDYEEFRRFRRLNEMSSVLMAQTIDADLRMFMLNAGNRVIMGNIDLPMFSVYSNESFQEAARLSSDEASHLHWFQWQEDNKLYYYAAKNIKDPVTQIHLATLFMGIPESYFNKLFDTLDNGSMMLLDQDGNRIVSSLNADYDPKKWIRTEKVINNLGWKLVYVTPVSQEETLVSREFLFSFLTISAFFVVFLIFSVYLARRITTPIYHLRNTAKRYVGGDRSVRMQVQGKDEMALLGNVFNRMLDDINRLIEQVEVEQEEKREMEMQALFSQIRPHFLLNTLNSIKVELVMAGDMAHSQIIASLISLLRAYIRPNEMATLEEECRLLENYLKIMHVRNKMDFHFNCCLEEETKDFQIPRLLLQPIIENAVIHGFALHPEHATIQLNATWTRQLLTIEIADNGRGMAEDKLQALSVKLNSQQEDDHSSSHGVGLINVSRRLKLAYGEGAALKVRSNEDGGLTFLLEIPYHQTSIGHS